MINNKIKALILGFMFSFIYSLVSFSGKCESISNKILRLHIIANSDTYEDQSLKLEIRDNILEKFGLDLKSSYGINDAEKKISSKIDEIREYTQNLVYDKGYNYKINVQILNMYFNIRKYENISMPAGFYKALRITIGEAKGKNWWCVMFPAMCLPAAQEQTELSTVLDDSEIDILENESKYSYKFKTMELILEVENFIETEIIDKFYLYLDKISEEINKIYDIDFKFLEYLL